VKLLFDENLSPRLVDVLADVFPGSQHVEFFGLRGKPDRVVWDHARQHDFVIASKDNDFRQMAVMEGPPPRVIWLSVGNAGTAVIAAFLRTRVADVQRFVDNPEESLLVLEAPLLGRL
jgi:predicted nuclease of predicted toxin-antitoxin system